MLWLALWLVVLVPVCSVFQQLIVWVIATGIEDALSIIASLLLILLAGSAFLAVLLYLFNLPFMLLVRFSPLYRERFYALFCPLSPDARPVSVEGEMAEGECSFSPGDDNAEPRP